MTKKIYSLIFLIFFCVTNALASDTYKNELTRIGFSKLGGSDVKITLYTAKPYSEPLRILKKNDSEFVLILPETYSSAPQKPSISDVIGDVTDVEVKLYSFVSNLKENGYTKIVIKTNGFVNLYPEAVTTGGGKLLNNEIHNILSSQLQSTQTTPQTNIIKPSNNLANNSPVSSPQVNENKPIIQNIQIPINENKSKNAEVSLGKNKEEIKKDIKTENIISKNIKKVIPQKTVSENKKEEKSNKEQSNIFDTEVLIPQNQIKDETNEANTEEPVVSNESIINNGNIIGSAAESSKATKTSSSQKDFPIQYSIIGIVLLLFVYKLITSAKKNNETDSNEIETENEISNNFDDADNENKGNYSDFFQNLIDSEIQGKNAFQLKPLEETDAAKDSEQEIKTHREALDIDQNLSWQEKFRAVQKNKRNLLKEDEIPEKIEENTHPTISETDENMFMENPIKKLKEDFKAVRKVLERQKKNESDTEQKIIPEKIEQVEVISFEDYQKSVELPKVQINTTAPLKTKPPKIVSQLQLNNETGLYLIDYNDKIALIGYIKDKVFKMSSYPYLNKTRLYARLSESVNGKDTYIVKFDDKKMLIDVINDEMQLKLTY